MNCYWPYINSEKDYVHGHEFNWYFERNMEELIIIKNKIDQLSLIKDLLILVMAINIGLITGKNITKFLFWLTNKECKPIYKKIRSFVGPFVGMFGMGYFLSD